MFMQCSVYSSGGKPLACRPNESTRSHYLAFWAVTHLMSYLLSGVGHEDVALLGCALASTVDQLVTAALAKALAAVFLSTHLFHSSFKKIAGKSTNLFLALGLCEYGILA